MGRSCCATRLFGPSMTPEAASEFADLEYPGDELDVFAHAQNWKAYFSRTLRPYIRGAVLEVGAGTGTTMLELNQGGAANWTCLEPDQSLAARIPSGEVNPGAATVDVRCGTLKDVAPGERFDVIIYIDVLEHIEDHRGEMALATQHLEQGGRVIVLSPAYHFLFSPFDEQVGHFRRYTRRSLRAVAPVELEVERLFHLDAVGAAASLLNKLVLRQSMPTVGQIHFWDRGMIPLSRIVDPLLLHSFGRSVIGVFRKPMV